MSKVKKLDFVSVISKLDKFLLFDNFFFNLAKFWDLNNFLSFEFLDLNNFLIFGFRNFSINLLLSLLLSILLAISTLLVINIYNNIIVFSINLSNVVILLNS